jgi:hypothetical protein
MARSSPRARPIKKRPNISDEAVREEVGRVLARVREIKNSLSDETDPQERRRTIRLLNSARRKFAAYRKSLEAFRDHPSIGRDLEGQIQLFLVSGWPTHLPDRFAA